MKLTLIIILVLLCSGSDLFSQDAPNSTYWVQLKDKNGTPYQMSHPEAFLSQRAIHRRAKQLIPIDETDLPVSPIYLDSLKNRGLEIIHTSKWLNGTTVRTSDTALIRKIAALPFVISVQFTKPAITKKSTRLKFREEELNMEIDPASYGNALNQLTQLNGQYLHDKGFRGKGIQIAVLDAGFWHVNEISAFDSLRMTNRILGTRDFVDPQTDIYQQHTHGMSVLSTMGGNLSGNLIGTAPDASYFLFRTEDDATEFIIEEDNWVAGAELADSLGVDVINSSLGYYAFDDSLMNHSYSDLNGKKTHITLGANMAFQKGILVVTSAGNEGNVAWKHIIAPADGENVIAVAAVDQSGKRASFSSVGPAFGGAVKPNAAALGSRTYLITSSGLPGYSNGTSFSSPVLAGMSACLMQANPYSTVKQIKMAIEQSSSIYNKPDSLLGYGIPDFEKADKYLKIVTVLPQIREVNWIVSPNPFTDQILIRNLNLNLDVDDNCVISICNLQGVYLWQSNVKISETLLLKNLVNLPSGLLILTIRTGGKEECFKLLKY